MTEKISYKEFHRNLMEINHKIRTEINEGLKEISPQARNYINDIVSLINNEVGINKILSIILFGSQQKKMQESTKVSDCDLLLIFKDRVKKSHIRDIERYFIALEIKHQFRDYEKDHIIEKILESLQQTTGMFISHFLTKQKYWEQAKFYRIFNVNRFFSTMFAPRNIVLCSVIDNSTILYGKDIREIVWDNIEVPALDMIKSMAMNLLISLFALAISPFKRLKPMKYTLEAVKWALRASNYYSFEDSELLERVCLRFRHFERYKSSQRHAKMFYKRFLTLRKDPRLDLGFMLRTPLRILKIHAKGFLFSKILAKEKYKIF
ncbi:MAG: hypothetical protein ACTSR8_17180 [Promethearchaeota archaeon]